MTETMLLDRAVIRLSGAGVVDFLQGLVTNDVAGPLPIYAGLLTPQGKALFDFIVWGSDDGLLIDCEAEQADALARRLRMYRLRRPIEIERAFDLAVHWSPTTGEGASDPRSPDLGSRWLAAPGNPASGWHARRLAQGVVEGVDELGSDTTLWLETNAREQNGVSMSKGCYVGQENTARMHYRDKVRRELAILKRIERPDDARAWYPELQYAVVSRRKGS